MCNNCNNGGLCGSFTGNNWWWIIFLVVMFSMICNGSCGCSDNGNGGGGSGYGGPTYNGGCNTYDRC